MPPLPSFAALLAPERVVCGLEASTKDAVLARGASLLATDARVRDAPRLVADLRAREARLSTGVGDGVALPHARTEAVSGTVVALATLAAPVGWEALDGQAVDLVVWLAGPEDDRARHVRLLARVSRLLAAGGVRQRLAAARSADEALAALREAETGA